MKLCINKYNWMEVFHRKMRPWFRGTASDTFAVITIPNMLSFIISRSTMFLWCCLPLHINTPTVPPSTIKADLSLTTDRATPPQNMLCLLKTFSLVRNVK